MINFRKHPNTSPQFRRRYSFRLYRLFNNLMIAEYAHTHRLKRSAPPKHLHH